MSFAVSATRSNPLPPTARAGQTITLLVAQPGLWRNSFEAYLRALPQLVVSAVCPELNAALIYLQHAAVDTLVLEAAVCGADLPTAIAALKSAAPNLNLILIVDTLADYRAAEASYPDRVLLKPLLPQPLDVALFTRQIGA